MRFCKLDESTTIALLLLPKKAHDFVNVFSEDVVVIMVEVAVTKSI